MHKLNDKTIGVILAIFSSFGLVFGFLAVVGVVSSKYVWGGRVTDRNQLVMFELATLVVNCLILWVIAMRVGFLKARLSAKFIRYILIFLMLVMILNTLGNIAAQTTVEKLFAIPTLISAIGFYILASRKSY